jgi:hypothetical protein
MTFQEQTKEWTDALVTQCRALAVEAGFEVIGTIYQDDAEYLPGVRVAVRRPILELQLARRVVRLPLCPRRLCVVTFDKERLESNVALFAHRAKEWAGHFRLWKPETPETAMDFFEYDEPSCLNWYRVCQKKEAAGHETAIRAFTDGGPITKDFAVVADRETAKCMARFHNKMEGQHHTYRLEFYRILEKCKADIARAAS